MAATCESMRDAPTFADLHQAVSQRATTEDLHTLSMGLQDQLSRRADALAERLAESQRQNASLTERMAVLEARLEACERRSAAVEDAVAAKCDSETLAAYVSNSDLDALSLVSKRDVDAAMASRVARTELETVLASFAAKRDVQEVSRLLEERPARTEVREFVEAASSRAEEAAAASGRRAREALEAADRLQSELAECARRATVEAELSKKVGVKALEARLGRVVTAARDVADRAISEGLQRLGGELRRRPTADEVARALEVKADAEEVRSALSTKADAAAVAEAIRRKAEGADVAALRATVASLAAGGALSGGGGGGGGGGGWSAAAARLEALLEAKAEAVEVRSLKASVDSRPSAQALASCEERCRAAAEAAESLDGRVRGLEEAADEAGAVAADARKAAEAAVARVDKVELEGPLLGRWVWKSRALADGGLVPWEHEVDNTDSESLLWEGAGSTRVVALRPGLYRLCVGFFTSRAPVVTVLVDGSPVLTSSQGGADHSSALGGSLAAASPRKPVVGRAGAGGPAAASVAAGGVGGVTLHRHPVGSVAGVSLVQFLALPQRAAVSVLFECEVRGQGFMELKKL